jgi:excinuclease ABC subunit C
MGADLRPSEIDLQKGIGRNLVHALVLYLWRARNPVYLCLILKHGVVYFATNWHSIYVFGYIIISVNEALEAKLKTLPKEPGVYFHKNKSGKIIYVGKAAVLRNRVRQYFQASRSRDPKTEALVEEIYDTDWMVVESELEALFLEAEMIRRYMPQYNILLRDDKSMSYIRIDIDSDYPTVTTTRRPMDDGAKYFGPYFSTYGVRQALKLLRRIFPFATVKPHGQTRASLYYHIGLDPGLEEGKTSLEDYRKNLRKLISVIEGKRTSIIKEIERDMNRAAKAQEFEAAARFRNQFIALQNLNKQVIFSDKEFLDISKDHALGELVDLLSLAGFPRRIEGYDISHMQGTNVVASMVVFTNGVSDKGEYRKFKTRIEHNNDFYNMNETIGRRLSEKNVKAWGKPNLILIDGGKGQLDAAIQARDAAGHQKLPFVGLAKREEQIVIQKDTSNVVLNIEAMHRLGGFATESDDFILVNIPHNTNVVKLLQRIRDESHRFAVSYHSVLKVKKQTASMLDDIPSIGPATRKKLIKTFGSIRGVIQADHSELEKVVGPKKAAILSRHLSPPSQVPNKVP